MKEVAKSYRTPHGESCVLKSVTLDIDAGEFVAVTGPSGSGKSTFLNLAGLLDAPTSGQVIFEGQEVSLLDDTGLSRIRKRRTGMVFQSFHLLPYRTAFENVLFRFRYTDVPGGEARELAGRAMEALGVAHLAAQKARLLSGGEMQRVAIARAIALPPAILLADEPTGNLDRAAAQEMMEALQALHRTGMTVVLVTHNEGLLGYCTRRLICDDGRIRRGDVDPPERPK
jgi:putative ABC transport system ATP-binding protein